MVYKLRCADSGMEYPAEFTLPPRTRDGARAGPRADHACGPLGSGKIAAKAATPNEEIMGLLKGALKTGAMMKIVQIARREASKAENRRKAKEWLDKVAKRGGRNPRVP